MEQEEKLNEQYLKGQADAYAEVLRQAIKDYKNCCYHVIAAGPELPKFDIQELMDYYFNKLLISHIRVKCLSLEYYYQDAYKHLHDGYIDETMKEKIREL